MILAAIIIGVHLIILIILCFILSNNNDDRFHQFLGMLVGVLLLIEISIVVDIIDGQKPTAMDVYQGKTTIEYTIRNNVKVDSVIVFKEDRNN